MDDTVARQSDYDEWVRKILNNLYQMERVLTRNPGVAMRYVARMKDALRENGWFFEDPQCQGFSETRSDLEVRIAGESVDDLVVVEVVRPIIRRGDEKRSQVVQKGVVIVQARSDGDTQ